MYGIQYGYFTIAFIIGLTYSTSEGAHPGGRKGAMSFLYVVCKPAMGHAFSNAVTHSTSEGAPRGAKGGDVVFICSL